jgi:exonuclease III
MKILSWNVRGLNMPLKQKEVRRLNLSIVCLVETLVKIENFPQIVASMLSGWEVVNNYSKHYLGKIWICWDPGGYVLEIYDIHG